MGTVVAMFDNYTDAERAVNLLENRGFARNTVSLAAQESAVVARNGSNGSHGNGAAHHPNEVAEGAGEGAMVGGGAGLVAGIAALMIPGVGPLFVTGALASVITSAVAGATAGAAAGGLAGGLAEHGLPEDTAVQYAEGVKSGGVMLSIKTDRVEQAREALTASNAKDMHDVVG